MKQIVFIIAAGVLFAGCATVNPHGAAFTFREGGTSGSVAGQRTGESCARSILGLVAFGDASVQTAAARSNIKSVNGVDYSDVAVLGVYAHRCVLVRGS